MRRSTHINPIRPLVLQVSLEWRGLHYRVATPTGPKMVLRDVSGRVLPGQLTALLGPSGTVHAQEVLTGAQDVETLVPSSVVHLLNHLTGFHTRQCMLAKCTYCLVACACIRSKSTRHPTAALGMPCGWHSRPSYSQARAQLFTPTHNCTCQGTAFRC